MIPPNLAGAGQHLPRAAWWWQRWGGGHAESLRLPILRAMRKKAPVCVMPTSSGTPAHSWVSRWLGASQTPRGTMMLPLSPGAGLKGSVLCRTQVLGHALGTALMVGGQASRKPCLEPEAPWPAVLVTPEPRQLHPVTAGKVAGLVSLLQAGVPRSCPTQEGICQGSSAHPGLQAVKQPAAVSF